MDNLCIGIDFGTSNSCLSVWYKNESIIIKDNFSNFNNQTIPTIIEFKDNKKIVGNEAYSRKEIFDKLDIDSNVIYEIKRLIGRSFTDLDDNEINFLGYNISSDDNNNIIINEQYYVEEIVTHIFMSFKSISDMFLTDKFNTDINITNAIISVPAKFNEVQREIIKKCATLSGFNVLRLLNEPTCASFSYGIRNNTSDEMLIIVFDLGGGTLDISLLQIFETNYEVVASCGNSSLGGSDFDKIIMQYCIDKFIEKNINDLLFFNDSNQLLIKLKELKNYSIPYQFEEFNKYFEIYNISIDFDEDFLLFDGNFKKLINIIYKKQYDIDYKNFISNINYNNLQKLKYLSEKSKISLSDNLKTNIVIENFYNELKLNVILVRDEINLLFKDIIKKIISCIDELLCVCKIERHNIQEIIMVGGMTKMPVVRSSVELFFGKNVNNSIDPDIVVSVGASIFGHMLMNKTDLDNKLTLIDRTTLSMGIESSGGIHDIIIPRNSIIPIRIFKKYTTDTDFMSEINIKIFEGERKMTKDNFFIGNFKLTGLTPEPKGEPTIKIEFYVDTSGILHITAEDLKNTLNKQSYSITKTNQSIDKEQLNKILENAKLMDNIDRIEKFKKQSHFNLLSSCNKILTNINNDELKIPVEDKTSIINNVNEIIEWLNNKNYDDIDIDEYKNLKNKFNENYSILLIHSKHNVDDNKIKSNNDEDDIGVKIYDDDDYVKNFDKEIKYFKNIITNYTQIINDIKNLEYSNFYFQYHPNLPIQNKNTVITYLLNLSNNIISETDDILINLYISKNITTEEMNNIVNNISSLDVQFKNYYNQYKPVFDLTFYISCLLKDKENQLNLSFEEINYSNEETNLTDLIEQVNKDDENNDEEINKKSKLLVEYYAIIYSMNKNYIEFDENKLFEIINNLNNL